MTNQIKMQKTNHAKLKLPFMKRLRIVNYFVHFVKLRCHLMITNDLIDDNSYFTNSQFSIEFELSLLKIYDVFTDLREFFWIKSQVGE